MADFMHQMIAVFFGSKDEEVKDWNTVDKPYNRSLTSFGNISLLDDNGDPWEFDEDTLCFEIKE
ncbi:hypothetical protein HOS16_gp59 [Shigella phage vB_SflS-ISF001]|uniref:Uncharacterized protein n=1 Tax=Shigella phage vB_SflS-ISF001 TaxID=2048005 RepID=A0A2D1GQ43_9CAUD|nr:hypothetical protein HOS16_gp59 [Shigella phage vB_SflS-ISF001]ATN94137.1 hypothetical protein FLXISF001_059 [Shigella phage vB_SflS-ISF001]